jgi:putative aldouronate transport system permease protein
MLYNRMKVEYTTLQYELMKLLSSASRQSSGVTTGSASLPAAVTPQSIRSAASIITIVPIVCLYPFLQRYFVTGLTIGGVKE